MQAWGFMSLMGTWCSGITPAQHAGGPGLNPQRVQVYGASSSVALRKRARPSGGPHLPKLLGKLYAMPPHPAPWPHWPSGVPARVVTVPLSPPQPPSLLLLQDAGC